ncbi:MAG: LytR C-terminal domain-containing protein [Angustibacter sp.]
MGAAENPPPAPVHWRVRRRRQQRQVLLIALSALVGLGGLALGSWLRTDQPPPTRLASASCEITPKARDISVRVLNGTRRPGLADQVADDLTDRDIRVSGIGNAPSAKAKIASGQTAVIFINSSAEQAARAKSLAGIFSSAKISATAGKPNSTIEVVLGPKFKSLAKGATPGADC